MYMSAGAHRGQKRASDPLELKWLSHLSSLGFFKNGDKYGPQGWEGASSLAIGVQLQAPHPASGTQLSLAKY